MAGNQSGKTIMRGQMILASPPNWAYDEPKTLNPEYYVYIGGEHYFAERSVNKSVGSELRKTTTVNSLNIETGEVETNMEVALVDPKPLKEFGKLAEILYA